MASDTQWRVATSAVHLLHRASHKADSVFLQTAGAFITPRQFIILAAVAEKPGVTQNAIVEDTGIDRSSVAELMQKLAKRGLLRRRRTKKDARAYAVRLTADGQEALRRLLPAAREADRVILGGTDQQLIKLLGRLLNRPPAAAVTDWAK
jgi:MarR family transcriptional regulator, temperature-dependent positive regulator of motility